MVEVADDVFIFKMCHPQNKNINANFIKLYFSYVFFYLFGCVTPTSYVPTHTHTNCIISRGI